MCYYGSWAVYRTGDGKFSVDNIDPTLCTHLIYTFVGITKQGKVEILDYQNDIVDGMKKNFFLIERKVFSFKLMSLYRCHR